MKKLTFFLLSITSLSLFAQEAIVTDRPTQSAAAGVVAKGNLLVEAGFVSERASSAITNLTYANFLLRYGVLEGVELRLTQNYAGVRDKIADKTISGMSPLTLGTKIHLIEEDGLVPQISVIGQVTMLTGEKAFRPSQAVPEIRMNFANTLSDRFSLGYNLGVAFPEDNTTSFYTAVLGYGFAEGWTVFAEPYGFYADDTFDHRFNTGLIYLMNSTLQFDVSAGWGLSESSPDSFIGFGVGLGF